MKKVNFFTVDLFESMGNLRRDYREIKELLIQIIDQHAIKINDFWVLDLTNTSDLHYTADIFMYKESCLFMRVSNQKPSGGFLHRDYTTNEPVGVLEGVSEDKEGIEVYTYALLDYETGILSIVNQQSAPNYKTINFFFSKYNTHYYMEFKPIPNPDGISRIYAAKEPRISQVEVEVPVPSAEALERMFGWNAKDILDVQGCGLKATMRLSGIERSVITDSEEETRGLIDCIRSNLEGYNKAKVRAKAPGIKTQEYSFFDENFSYPIEIPAFTMVKGEKCYFSSNELISIYRERLQAAYYQNIMLLRTISDRNR